VLLPVRLTALLAMLAQAVAPDWGFREALAAWRRELDTGVSAEDREFQLIRALMLGGFAIGAVLGAAGGGLLLLDNAAARILAAILLFLCFLLLPLGVAGELPRRWYARATVGWSWAVTIGWVALALGLCVRFLIG